MFVLSSVVRRRSRAFRALAVAAVAGGLAGCNSSALTSYDLLAAPSVSARKGTIRGALTIGEPRSDNVLDSDRIVVRTGPTELAYLSDAQWSERLPALVQNRLIATFQNAHFLRLVGRPGDPSDYDLIVDLRRFEIDTTTNEARIEMAVRIMGAGKARAVAGKVFTASAPAPHTANGAAAAALDTALATAMRAIVAWTAAAI